MGHDVTLIVPNQMFEKGQPVNCDECDYISNDGFRVIRIKYKRILSKRITSTCSLLPVYKLLNEIEPDLIHFHCLISLTLNQVSKYVKKHKKCKLIIDNHLDYNIGYKPKNSFKDWIIVRFYRFIYSLNKKQVTRVYGVTPWRKKYAEEIFGVSPSITDVLIMGADDEAISFSNRKSIRKEIRKKYNIDDDTFLIVTGGKIDQKKNIHLLADAIRNIKKVKLMIFGNCLSSFEKTFENSLNDKCIYIGWIDANKVYDYFFAADLVAFPGQHSVLWEQACASKTPCFFKMFEGMNHINNGGTSVIVDFKTSEELAAHLEKMIFTDYYYRVKSISESEKTDIYLYSNIAKKSLETIVK